MVENTNDNSEFAKIIDSINTNRQKHIDIFVNAFLAQNAPKDFDLSWLKSNVILNTKTWVENGQCREQYWIEINN